MENLFDPDFASNFEHLALVDRITGPFSAVFARQIERVRPGSFRFHPKVEVVFPPKAIRFPRGRLAPSLRRVQQAKPICVSDAPIRVFTFLLTHPYTRLEFTIPYLQTFSRSY